MARNAVSNAGLALGVVVLWGLSLFRAHQVLSHTGDGGSLLSNFFAHTHTHFTVDPAEDVETRASTSLRIHPRPERPEPVAVKSPSTSLIKDDIHVVFSTDCSAYQHWQSFVLFYSAIQVNQPGQITRIASGCSDEEAQKVKEYHSMLGHDNIHVHFTPDFKTDPTTGKSYDFYNKPFGLLHWLKHSGAPESVVAVIDPDFLFLRPLSPIVGDAKEILVTNPVKLSDIPAVVSKGHPVGQQYGLGHQWLRFNREYICGGNDSPCLNVTETEADGFYSVGPPYIAHREDLRRIAETWADFVPRIFEEYPHLLAEMYGYCMAAAHLKLPHGRVDHMMVSNTQAGGEGWKFVDELEGVCEREFTHSTTTPLPTFIHYCQTYKVDDWFFHKRRVATDSDIAWPQKPTSILSCDHSLPAQPPEDLPQRLFAKKPQNVTIPLKTKQAKRNAFMLCETHNRIANALEEFKGKLCQGQANVRRDYRIPPPNPL